MKDTKLVCTKCGKEYSVTTINYRCFSCNEPLEISEIKTGSINQSNNLNQNILERYQDFFPFKSIPKSVSLGEGFTSLFESKNLAEKIGLKNLYIKNESVNPTWSFKDRGTFAGVIHALKLGIKHIGTVSTGNMAPSVAAYGSKANLKTTILVNDSIADEKLKPIAIYHPKLIKVKGDYGKLYFESLKIGKEKGIYFINSDVPLRVEGSKTIAFEICEQLNFNMPSYVVVPTSAGGNLRGIAKGFKEFRNCGLINKIPKLICAQAAGCSPIFNAYSNNKITIERVNNPKTIAHAIENPLPPSGNVVLRLINKNGGVVTAVNEQEIIKAQALLAKDGVFVQPASAVSLAAVIKLKKDNYIKKSDTVVCVVTGSGLKYTAAFKNHNLNVNSCSLSELSGFIS